MKGSSSLTSCRLLILSRLPSSLIWVQLTLLVPALGTRSPLSQNGAPIHRVRAHSLTGIRNSYLMWLLSEPGATIVSLRLFYFRFFFILHCYILYGYCACDFNFWNREGPTKNQFLDLGLWIPPLVVLFARLSATERLLLAGIILAWFPTSMYVYMCKSRDGILILRSVL